MENEELLLRNTFLNARMGPLADNNDQNSNYINKPKAKGSVMWADQRGMPLAQEENDEYVLMNKTNFNEMNNRGVPFGPKYTGQGKLDFYSQNDFSGNELRKEEVSDFDINSETQQPGNKNPQRAKFVPISNTKSNDLNNQRNKHTSSKRPHISQSTKPSYQKLSSSNHNKNTKERDAPIRDKYYNNYKEQIINGNLDGTTKINNSFIPPPEDTDSRNEIFTKGGTDPSFQERKPLSNLQVQMPKSNIHSSGASKSENMHTKINRGISPNQPPHNKAKMNNQNDNKKLYKPLGVSKHEVKHSSESARRSSSLKVKKENERMGYNKPSPSSRGNHKTGSGGSIIVPSNNSSFKKNEGPPKKHSKMSSSANSIRTSYSKNNGLLSNSNQNNSSNGGHYRLGSNYGMRNPGNNNFTANTRIRKPTNTSGTVNNTMASFRQGPVKVVSSESNNNNNITSSKNSNNINNPQRKDASKRPSSASKVNKNKSSKMVNKSNNRPGTASTRASSNRPPSPGSRSLKSDHLFNSYNRHK